MDNRDHLSEQIHRLGDLLGETIVEQEGQPLFDLVEEVRGLAKAHRAGDAESGARLLARIESLPLPEARGVVKAFSSYFSLVNLAEEQERVRILRQRAHEARREGQPVAETMEAAFVALRDQGMLPDEARSLVGGLSVMPVFTAHPTEAKRRTVLLKLADVAEVLERLDSGTLTPDESDVETAWLRELIVSLWETQDTRYFKPTVLDEVRGGLYYFEHTLFDLVPQMERSLRLALERAWPGEAVRRAPLPHLRELGRGGPRRQPLRHAGGHRGDAPRAAEDRAAAVPARVREDARAPERRGGAGGQRGASRQPRSRTRRSSRRRPSSPPRTIRPSSTARR